MDHAPKTGTKVRAQCGGMTQNNAATPMQLLVTDESVPTYILASGNGIDRSAKSGDWGTATKKETGWKFEVETRPPPTPKD